MRAQTVKPSDSELVVAEGRSPSEAGERVAVPSPTQSAEPSRGKWRAFLGSIAAVVQTITESIRRMPELKEPVFDSAYLPENTNAVACVAYTWMYNFRRFEYAVDPMRRGFAAWVRLLLFILLFIAIPLVVLCGVCWAVIYLCARLCGVAGAALSLVWNLSLLVLGVAGIVVVLYLAYVAVRSIHRNRVNAAARPVAHRMARPGEVTVIEPAKLENRS